MRTFASISESKISLESSSSRVIVEGFDEAVLPRIAWIDEQWFDIQPIQEYEHFLSDKLPTIIRPDMDWYTSFKLAVTSSFPSRHWSTTRPWLPIETT